MVEVSVWKYLKSKLHCVWMCFRLYLCAFLLQVCILIKSLVLNFIQSGIEKVFKILYLQTP